MDFKLLESGSLVRFSPKINGFHFPNDFKSGPVLTLKLPWFGDIPIGNASGGLCGGMVFTAIDLFSWSQLPSEAMVPPEPGTVFYEILCKRQIDSFDGIKGIMKYLSWMRLPSHIVRWPFFNSIWAHTVDECPSLMSKLDGGNVVPLAVIQVESVNPLHLGENHQVLAYGYSVDSDTDDLTINVYDPNYPDRDNVTIKLNLSVEGKVTLSTNPNARGFFITRYK